MADTHSLSRSDIQCYFTALPLARGSLTAFLLPCKSLVWILKFTIWGFGEEIGSDARR